jgi:hypothetical protein
MSTPCTLVPGAYNAAVELWMGTCSKVVAVAGARRVTLVLVDWWAQWFPTEIEQDLTE